MMKRILSLILIAVLCLQLVGCKSNKVQKTIVTNKKDPGTQMVVSMNPQITYTSGDKSDAFSNITSLLEDDLSENKISLNNSTYNWKWLYYDENAKEWVHRENIQISAWQNILQENEAETPYSYTFNNDKTTALTPYVAGSVVMDTYDSSSVPRQGVMLSISENNEEGLCYIVENDGKISIEDSTNGKISIIRRVESFMTDSLKNDEIDRSAQVIIYHNGEPLWAAEFGNPRHYGSTDENAGVYSADFPKLENISVKKGDMISIVVKNQTDARTALSLIPDEYKEYVVASKMAEVDGRSYIDVGGKPYLIWGVQSRLDRARRVFEVATDAQYDTYIEPYFAKTAELGFTTIIFNIHWYEVELMKDVYSFELLKRYYDLAKKYDLKVHLLWFGSNLCGWNTSCPNYILSDKETYSRLDNYPEVLDYSDMDTIYREQLAFSKLLEFLYEYDKDLRTISIAVGNEMNMQANGGPKADNMTDGDTVDKAIWVGGQKQQIFNLMNALGMMVKTGPYRCVVRAYFVTYECYTNGLRNHELDEVVALDGVDIAGFDSYAAYTTTGLLNQMTISGNIPHYPEYGAAHEYTIPQALMSFARSGGMLLYQIKAVDSDSGYDIFPDKENVWNYRTGEYFIKESASGEVKYQENYLGHALRQSETTEFISLNKILNKVAHKVALSDPKATAVFNIARELNTSETATVGALSVKFTNSGENNYGGCGYATKISDNEYLIFATKGNSKFALSGAEIVSASTGAYDSNGNWKSDKELGTSNSVAISSDMASNGTVVLVKTK